MSFENKQPFTIDTDNNVDDVMPENGKDFKAAEIYKLCECDTFQMVYLPNKINGKAWEMWLDEEGKLKNLPINQQATYLYNNPYDVIVGKVLICPKGFVK